MSGRREQILRELGLAPLWKLRRPAGPSTATSGSAVPAPLTALPDVVDAREAAVETRAPLAAAPEALAVRRAAVVPPPPGAVPFAPAQDERAARIAAMDWPQLAEAVAACRACRLCEQRKQAVLGVGDRAADWLFVGEGPGAEEDERGEPFVGQAGRLLDAMLAAIGLKRGADVYIANSVKCRPPGNRTPAPEEMGACFPYLERQIALIRPRLVVALGRPAAQALLGSEVKIAAARGRLFAFREIPLLVTYHPAYLLRNLPDKAKAWEDLCFARRTMRRLRGDEPE